jgi:hypothetical protein
MTHSIYDAVIEIQDWETDKIFIHLDTLCPGIFDDLWTDVSFSISDKKAVLLYIIICYSRESPSVVLGASSSSVKNNIAEHVGLPDYHRKAVLLLDNLSVRSTILRYLDFQSDRDFRHLEIVKMQYDAMMSASVEDMKGDDGKTDFKQLYQTMDMANKLLGEIEILEDRIRSKHAYVDTNKAEIKEVAKKAESTAITSLSIESSPSIRKPTV